MGITQMPCRTAGLQLGMRLGPSLHAYNCAEERDGKMRVASQYDDKCRELTWHRWGPLAPEYGQDCLSTVPGYANELAAQPDVYKVTAMRQSVHSEQPKGQDCISIDPRSHIQRVCWYLLHNTFLPMTGSVNRPPVVRESLLLARKLMGPTEDWKRGRGQAGPYSEQVVGSVVKLMYTCMNCQMKKKKSLV